jgi:hypothetical protein
MVTVIDQFAAVLAAPIPFALAFVAFGIVVWRMMEWRYGGVIEKTSAMMKLAEFEAKVATQKRDELAETVNKISNEMEALKEKDTLTPAQLQPLSASTAIAVTQLSELGRANSAVSQALSRGITIGSPTMTVPKMNER